MVFESDMDDQKIIATTGRLESLQKAFSSRRLARAGGGKYPQGQKGIAIVAALVVIPLVFAVGAVVTTSFVVFKRKSLGQSLCVQQGVKTQEQQRETLRILTKMNKAAKALRAMRTAADIDLQAARASGLPYWIAAAEAVWQGVYNAQKVFHAAQLALLAKAQVQRRLGETSLRVKVARTRFMKHFRARDYYDGGLAVEPDPEDSDSPDYVPVEDFKNRQRQLYSFDVELYPGKIPAVLQPGNSRFNRYLKNDLENARFQVAECVVSLEEKENDWDIQIIAASRQSNSWF